MKKKTCDAFFCNKQTPKKFRYCYDCARNKGLVGSKNNWGMWAILIVIVFVVFG